MMSLRVGSIGADYAYGIVATPHDTLVFAGQLAGSVDFGGGSVTPFAGPFVAWLEP
jgi:hypothetical protein